MTLPDQRDDDGYYTHPLSGVTYPSVSTVLRVLDKGYGLWRWQMNNAAEAGARLATEEARRILLEGGMSREDTLAALDPDDMVTRVKSSAVDVATDNTDAADLGTLIHGLVEREWYEPIPEEDMPPEASGQLEHFRLWRKQWQPEPLLVEATVYNHGLRYAGTLDAVVTLPGLGTTLIDVKSGKRTYTDTVWQLAAYGAAEEAVIGPPWATVEVPPIDTYAVLHLRPRSARFVPYTPPPYLLDHLAALAAVQALLDSTEWKHAMHEPLLNPPTEDTP